VVKDVVAEATAAKATRNAVEKRMMTIESLYKTID
jgi:hypothetical protein